MQLKELSGDWMFQIPAYAMAGATTDREDVAMRVPYAMVITAVDWVPQAAVTANGTNYSTLSLRNRGSGSGSALPASRSYAATNSAAFTAESMTLSSTASDLALAAGDVLTVQMIHTASGVIIPAGVLRVLARITG
jgi:hypothetical protein